MDGELRVLSGRVTQVFLEVVYRYQRYPQFIVQTKKNDILISSEMSE